MDMVLLSMLNDSIKANCRDYISLIAVGSIVTGDPFIENRSDRDILLVFEKYPVEKLSFIEKTVHDLMFDSTYVFTPIPRIAFGQSNSKYTFSNRFRSKTLFGEDLVSTALLPALEDANKMHEKGLAEVKHRLTNYLVNSGVWNINKIRDVAWKQFKHAFMYLAILEYTKSGDYPTTRKEIANRFKSKELAETYNVLHNIDNVPKEQIITCVRQLTAYLNQI